MRRFMRGAVLSATLVLTGCGTDAPTSAPSATTVTTAAPLQPSELVQAYESLMDAIVDAPCDDVERLTGRADALDDLNSTPVGPSPENLAATKVREAVVDRSTTCLVEEFRR